MGWSWSLDGCKCVLISNGTLAGAEQKENAAYFWEIREGD